MHRVWNVCYSNFKCLLHSKYRVDHYLKMLRLIACQVATLRHKVHLKPARGAFWCFASRKYPNQGVYGVIDLWSTINPTKSEPWKILQMMPLESRPGSVQGELLSHYSEVTSEVIDVHINRFSTTIEHIWPSLGQRSSFDALIDQKLVWEELKSEKWTLQGPILEGSSSCLLTRSKYQSAQLAGEIAALRS